MTRPILEVANLSVDIRTAGGTLQAVRDVSFSVGRGETLCLVGESGCGKSVTSLAIMDLLPRAATRRAIPAPRSHSHHTHTPTASEATRAGHGWPASRIGGYTRKWVR